MDKSTTNGNFQVRKLLVCQRVVALWSYGDLSNHDRIVTDRSLTKDWGHGFRLDQKTWWDMASEGRDFNNLLTKTGDLSQQNRIR